MTEVKEAITNREVMLRMSFRKQNKQNRKIMTTEDKNKKTRESSQDFQHPLIKVLLS